MADVEVTSTGARLSVRAGDRIVVSLPENAGTGHLWMVEEVGDTLALESDNRVPPGADDPTAAREPVPPGAAGNRVLTFRALRNGPARLVLVKKRPWESAAVERFESDVIVG
jgi:inhibitor of cysteine peptidase